MRIVMHKTLFKPFILSLMLNMVLPTAVFAKELELDSVIKNQMDLFIKNTVSIQNNEKMSWNILHPEILAHLEKCDADIQMAHTNPMNPEKSTSLELNCTGSSKWKRYVPIKISIFSPLLVAKKNLNPGELIESNTEKTLIDKNQIQLPYFTDENQLTGKIAAQPISAGSVIVGPMLKSQTLISRNQTVHVSVLNGSINLQMDGIARSDASLNEPVKIENPATKRVFEAIASGPGEAKIII